MEMLLAIQFSLVLLFVNMTGCVGETDNIVLNSDIVQSLLTQVNENTDLIKNLVEENGLLKVRMTAIEKHARHDSFILRKKIKNQSRLVNNLVQLVARISASSMSHYEETRPISQNNIITHFNSTEEHTHNNTRTNQGQAEPNQQPTNVSAIKKATHGRIRRQTVVGVNVAFTAGIYHGNVDGSYIGSDGMPVIFEYVVTNNGNAYDNRTGKFRAPVAGTYVFSTTLMTASSEPTYYYIDKNGESVSGMSIRGQVSRYLSTSNTVVMELVPGDVISVCNSPSYSDQELLVAMYSLFSGFMLHQHFAQGTISVVD